MGKTICIFAAQYLPVMGGVQQYSHQLGLALHAQGHRVIIVTSANASAVFFGEEKGLLVCRLPCWPFVSGRSPVPRKNAEYRRLWAQLEALDVDGVLVQTRLYALSLEGARYAKRKSVPCLVLDHGSSHVDFGNAVFNYAGRVYEHLLTALIKRNCRHFYGVSKSSATWLTHFGIQPEGVLYNAVDVGHIQDLLHRPATNYREAYGLSENAVAVAYAGRLLAIKGIMPMAVAVQRLAEKGLDIHLFLAGDGPVADEICSMRASHVHLLGRLPFSDVIALLHQADIFCLPTVSEGMPTVILEAVLCNCYCVTTPFGGQAEVILNEEYGTLLREISVPAIEAGLREALEKGEGRQTAIDKCKARVCERFVWPKTASETLLAFERIVQEERS